MKTIKRWETNAEPANDLAKDLNRYVRWLAVGVQLVLVALMLAGAAALTVALRVARDSLLPDALTLESTVLFAIAEAGRSMLFQLLGKKALQVLEPVDAAVFLVPAVKESWQARAPLPPTTLPCPSPCSTGSHLAGLCLAIMPLALTATASVGGPCGWRRRRREQPRAMLAARALAGQTSFLRARKRSCACHVS